ncbi:MAG: hypothetical protein ABSD92_10825 [Candidatus Bathyarchaeia archaeon]
MPERTVSLGIDKAYTDLKAALIEKGFKIISEDSPKEILVKQGSLWGVSPRTAKKSIVINFDSIDSGSRISWSSRVSSDWKNLTIVGCVLAAVLVGLCLWITFDLQAFMITQKPSFWSWLATVNGKVDFQVGQALVNLTKALAIFLSAIIVLEIVVVVYVQTRLDKFVSRTLDSLLSREPTGTSFKK